MSVPLTRPEKERLGRRYAAELAPRLRAAINREDADRIAALTSSLGRQELLALVVVLASEWPTVRCRQMVVCRNCREYDRHEGDGYCVKCHRLWEGVGRPTSGPPLPTPPEVSGRLGALHLIEGKAERVQEYAHLATARISDEEAAKRLGVTAQTVAGYRRQLRREDLQLRIPSGDRRAS